MNIDFVIKVFDYISQIFQASNVTQYYVRFDERNNQRGTVYKEDSNKWFPATEKGSLITKYADEAHLEHYLRYYSIL